MTLCRWPGCERTEQPGLLFCQPHWFRLPPYLRSMIGDAPADKMDVMAEKALHWIKTHPRSMAAVVRRIAERE